MVNDWKKSVGSPDETLVDISSDSSCQLVMDSNQAGQSSENNEEEHCDVLQFDGDVVKHIHMLLKAPEQGTRDFKFV